MTINIDIKHPSLIGGKLRYQHLLGRKFEMGKTDCYQLAVDLMKDNFGIEMTNYARSEQWWLEPGVDLYQDNFRKEGWHLVDDLKFDELQPFDAFLIAIPDHNSRATVKTNHCAVYLTDGYIIHHRLGCLSTVERYKGTLRNLTTHTIRHKDVPDLRNYRTTKVDIMDHILPHKREALLKAIEDAKQTGN